MFKFCVLLSCIILICSSNALSITDNAARKTLTQSGKSKNLVKTKSMILSEINLVLAYKVGALKLITEWSELEPLEQIGFYLDCKKDKTDQMLLQQIDRQQRTELASLLEGGKDFLRKAAGTIDAIDLSNWWDSLDDSAKNQNLIAMQSQPVALLMFYVGIGPKGLTNLLQTINSSVTRKQLLNILPVSQLKKLKKQVVKPIERSNFRIYTDSKEINISEIDFYLEEKYESLKQIQNWSNLKPHEKVAFYLDCKKDKTENSLLINMIGKDEFRALSGHIQKGTQSLFTSLGIDSSTKIASWWGSLDDDAKKMKWESLASEPMAKLVFYISIGKHEGFNLLKLLSQEQRQEMYGILPLSELKSLRKILNAIQNPVASQVQNIFSLPMIEESVNEEE